MIATNRVRTCQTGELQIGGIVSILQAQEPLSWVIGFLTAQYQRALAVRCTAGSGAQGDLAPLASAGRAGTPAGARS
jgi:hypothetical protein